VNKPLPSNLTFEAEVLSMLMLVDDESDLRYFLGKLNSDDFHHPDYAKIFHSFIELNAEGLALDAHGVIDKLGSDFLPILVKIVDVSATAVFLDDRIVKLREYTVKRKALTAIATSGEKLHDNSENVYESIMELTTEIEKLHYEYHPKHEFTTLDTLRETVDHINAAKKGTGDLVVPYGINSVDRSIKLLRKQMHVLAAHSGIGKTAFALSAMRKQIQYGGKIVFFCGESSRHELVIRLMSILTGFEFMWFMEPRNLTAIEAGKVTEAVQWLKEKAGQFWIFGKGDYSHSHIGIRDIMVSLTQRFGRLDMIYVDYLQNMKPPKGLTHKEEIVSRNIAELNNILADFNVAGTILSQLNREARRAGKPHMEHLKYASTIENEAHIITFLHRSEATEPIDGALPTEWYSDKTRVQSPIFAKLAFHARKAEYTGILGHNIPDYDKQYSG